MIDPPADAPVYQAMAVAEVAGLLRWEAEILCELSIILILLITSADPSKCARVIDGDTIHLNDGRKVRLLDIDAPEIKQPWGLQSKKFLADLIEGKEIELIGSKKDRYGRTLATIKLGDLDVNKRLVEMGHAWHYKRYSKSKEFADLELKARAKGLGLWAPPKPPWEWRRRKRKK